MDQLHGMLGDTKVGVEAVVDPARWRRMREAGSVSPLEFSAASTVLDRPVTGPLDYLVGPARIGNVQVSVKVSASRSRTSMSAREQTRTLSQAAEELALQVGAENIDRVEVTTFDEDMAGLKVGSVDLLKQRFTMKSDIRLSSGTNSSVSEVSAFDAIMARGPGSAGRTGWRAGRPARPVRLTAAICATRTGGPYVLGESALKSSRRRSSRSVPRTA